MKSSYRLSIIDTCKYAIPVWQRHFVFYSLLVSTFLISTIFISKLFSHQFFWQTYEDIEHPIFRRIVFSAIFFPWFGYALAYFSLCDLRETPKKWRQLIFGIRFVVISIVIGTVLLLMLLGYFLFFVAALHDVRPPVSLVMLTMGTLALMYLGARLIFYPIFVVDHNCSPFTALRASWIATRKIVVKFTLAFILVLSVNIITLVYFSLLLILTLPAAVFFIVQAYDLLFIQMEADGTFSSL